MNKYETFLRLHHHCQPLVMGNCWNAHSAKLLENNSYKALGTSSAAIANSLGFDDGENISFDELFFVVERIVRSVKVPVSVDIETGYSENVNQVISNIGRLYYAGVVGINIEDSQQGKLNQVNAFSEKLNVIKKHLEKQNMKMFVNARTDSFLLRLPNPVENALERIKVYQNAGVDGIFVPFVSEEDAIRKILAATSLPVNVLYSPQLPSYETLR